jgi:membrane glycosyltransferase
MMPLAAEPLAAVPDEAPIPMPEQSLWSPHTRVRRLPTSPHAIWLRRALVLTATLILTATAAYQMYLVVTVNGPTVLQALVLLLYVLLFAWVAFSFVTVLLGCVLRLLRVAAPLEIDSAAPLPQLTTRCALLVPTYNEAPVRVIARVEAMYESVASTGQLQRFDVFILSDTTDPDIWIGEEANFLDLRQRTLGQAHIFYRHRVRNEGRKAGNVGEWVRRFGGHYEAMIVLDADSLMTGDTIVRLVAALERNPQVGLIQTFPIIVNGRTLFARLQQFANRLYGPAIAHGLAWWHGPEGNYWGHNAVIRVRAFAQGAGLPLLPGRRPFGGPIMSHDFVEAALMRRRGWAIHMVPGLAGSFEEAPPSIIDYAARDRRWCQGNLQHLAVLPARGLHWVSRLHLLTGIGSYITAPLWLAFLLFGVLISLQAQFVRPEYFPSGFALFPHWPVEDPVRAGWVFAGTMALLIAPKLLGYGVLLADRGERQAWGTPTSSFVAVLIEILVSGLLAPVMMWTQSSAVAQILLGRDAGWSAQRRDDGTIPVSSLLRRYAWHTAAGLALAAAAYAVSVPLLLWMSPVIAGLLLAVPLAALTSGQTAGWVLRRLQLLLTPEERRPPDILLRANELVATLTPDPSVALAPIRMLMESPALLAAHREMLPARRPTKRGEVNVELVVGLARLDQCDTFEEAIELLTGPERSALLADRTGVDRLRALWERRRDRAA